MQRNREFDFMGKIIFSIIFWLFFAQNIASAESIQGRFFNGQAYSGEYSVAEGANSDGMRINLVNVKLMVGAEQSPLIYSYIADAPPSIKASEAGFLSIIVNSGGMEGSVAYNYVIPDHGKLISIGTTQTTLHLGKIENIDVQPNKMLSASKINELILGILRFNPPALIESPNAYPIAALVLLGRGKFLAPSDRSELSKLYTNKEISDEAILLHALKGVIGTAAQNYDANQISTRKIVVSDRAYFFNYPMPSSAAKSYLIKGDSVSLVKKSDDSRYWLVDYISPSGKKIEKWLRCEDVNYCH
ncbi:hypothetical protein BCO9919_07415 [Burkholderia cenocepacia]|uniref:Uncharacterized protein n=1 Tax=Burkholderia cenocepacia TaxID=95486 RepID=A0A6J5JWU8_9BURK|nr:MULTISPECIES: hypothetical protein [Burkholderia cepacia complex]CAB3976059.1 hypothetical protein BCO9919_07415 [Burkholderia cenocepacia]